jgi:hypothetical protein
MEQFITLLAKKGARAPKTFEVAKPKKNSKDKKPFKKGSWAHALFKKIKRWKSPKNVEDFHYTKQENLLVIDKKGKVKTIKFSKKPSEEQITKISEKWKKDTDVLINCGEGIFLRISWKCYLKLIQIDKIAISIQLLCSDDAGEEEFTAYEDDQIFDNINSFLSWVNYYRQLVYGVCEIQSHMCGFMYVKYKAKTLVTHKDGSIHKFKGDFNEVLSEYDFDPLL